jgi:hypothetical protein
MDPLVTQTRAVCGFVQIRLDLGPGTRNTFNLGSFQVEW